MTAKINRFTQADYHRRKADEVEIQFRARARVDAIKQRHAWIALARRALAGDDLDVAVERIKAAQAIAI